MDSNETTVLSSAFQQFANDMLLDDGIVHCFARILHVVRVVIYQFITEIANCVVKRFSQILNYYYANADKPITVCTAVDMANMKPLSVMKPLNTSLSNQ